MSFLVITLLVLGIIVWISGALWMGIQAFADHEYWGLAYFLLPGSWLVFSYVKWKKEKVKKTFALQVLGYLLIAMAGIIRVLGNPNLFASKQVPIETPPPSSPLPSPSPSPSPSPELTLTYRQYMNIGYSAYDRGDYQTALINFQRALIKRSDDEYALDAIRNTEETIERRRYQKLMRIGYTAYDNGDYQTALINFQRALTVFPDDYHAIEAIKETERVIKQRRQ